MTSCRAWPAHIEGRLQANQNRTVHPEVLEVLRCDLGRRAECLPPNPCQLAKPKARPPGNAHLDFADHRRFLVMPDY